MGAGVTRTLQGTIRLRFPGAIHETFSGIEEAAARPESGRIEVLLLPAGSAADAEAAARILDSEGLQRWPVVAMAEGPGSEGIVFLAPRDLNVATLGHAVDGAVRLHRQLREIARLKGDLRTFGRRVVHDLRTPLGGIQTASDGIREMLHDGPGGGFDFVGPLAESALALSRLLDRSGQLATMIGAGVAPESLHAAEPVWAALGRLDRPITERRAKMVLQDDWPEVVGDAAMLETVWANLVANALQHGAQEPVIELGWRRHGGEIEFSVEDNGPGVAVERRAKLFTSFHRLHGPDAPRGLGLPIVRRLVGLLGGTCGYEDGAKGGARFWFRLPAAGSDAPAPVAEAPATDPAFVSGAAVLADRARLDALIRTRLMDSPPEPDFDRITGLASRLLRAPVALISLVDDRRQFFKAATGLPEPWATRRETPLSHSFCKTVVTDNAVLQVADARLDARVRDNPVIGELGVTAYLGVPLRTSEGHTLGSLCAIDDQPREWSIEDRVALEELAALVTTELDFRDQLRRREEMEGTLRRREQQLRFVTDNAPVLLAQCDAQHRFVFVNRSAGQRLDLDPNEVVGRHIADVIGHEAHRRLLPYIERVLDGEEVEFETEVPYRKLGVRTMHAAYSPSFDERGTVVGWLAAFTDLTERRRTESALSLSQNRLNLATQTGKIGLWEWDVVADKVTWSESLYAIHGLRPDEFSGTVEGFSRLVHPEDRDAVAKGIAEALSGEAAYEREFRALRPDGGVVWLFTNAVVVRSEGKPVRMEGATLDITDRKRAEFELQRRSRALEILNRVATSLVAERDIERITRIVTDAGRRLAGAAFGMFHRRGPEGSAGAGPLDPVLRGEGPVRVADLQAEGLPESGHPIEAWLQDERPVRSCVAVPVVANSGAVLGALFFGRTEPGAFSRDDEDELKTLASQAAIALDSAGLYTALQTELTDHRGAETALRESETRFRTMADNIAQFAWMAAPDGFIHWYNRRWFDFTGTTLEEMKGWGWKRVHHPDHVDRVVEKFSRHLRTQETWEDTFPLLGADGVYRWFLSRAIPIRGESGEVLQWFGTNTDITDLRRAEEALRESEERLKLALAAAEMGVWSWDFATGTIFWSDYVHRIFGVERFGGDFEAFSRLVVPEDLPVVRAAVDASVARRTIYAAEFRIVRPDGEVRWVANRGRAYYGADGAPLRMVGTVLDITERRNAEDALKRARDEAVAASKAKDDFLAALSHELRTPLNPVLLLASESAEDPALSPEVRADFAVVRNHVELEARLIDDLLDLTRITQGKLVIALEPLDAHTVLNEAIETCRPDVEAKEIELVLHLDASRHCVQADAVRLRQVLWNVIKNAVKFTPDNGQITVTSRDSEDDGALVITVSDTGIGMTDIELDRVFGAFAQGDHAAGGGSHRFGGLGLGLAISRMLVERHGGSITASSEGRNHGSTFVIRMPMIDSGLVGAGGESCPNQTLVGGTPEPVSDSRILLVEDHEPTRTALAHLLKRRRYRIMTAGSLAEAQSLARTNKFDLLISDIGLPDGSGYELMAALRNEAGLRGIALTGYGMEHDLARSRSAGFEAHLTKPIRVQSLDAALASLARSGSPPPPA